MSQINSCIKKVLTIATSDSGGGAGIQTDLKTITALNAYGTSVLVALTAQNTLGVQGIHALPSAFIGQQLDSVLTDIGTDAAKTGMLFTKEIVTFVAEKIHMYNVPRLVVDPVMVASSGDLLLKPDAVEAYRRALIPLAFMVTPNRHEAEVLSGIKINSTDDMKTAAQIIFDFGCPYVLVKGGHLTHEQGQAVDVLYDGRDCTLYNAPYVANGNTHGTGCTLSAALATFLAQGLDVFEAVARGKRFITKAITYGIKVGHGNGPTDPHRAGCNFL